MIKNTCNALQYCLAFGVLFSLIGCGGTDTSPLQADARRFLQIDQPQEALDVLSGIDASEGEVHYLRSLAFERLKNKDAAATEIDLAIADDEENAKFAGLKLRQRLFAKDLSAADEIIELYDQNSSTPAVALFAVYAFQAKAVQYRAEGKARASKANATTAIEIVEACVVMSSEIPEFHRELISFALQSGLAADARKLIDRMQRIDPDNPTIARDRIAVYLLADEIDSAVSAAKTYYRQQKRTEESALVYSGVLVTAKGNEVRDEEFRELIRAFPLNIKIAEQFAIYLARDARVTVACEMLRGLIDRSGDGPKRTQLISTNMALALDRGTADFAASELDHYRDDIKNELMIKYYEGRVLYMQRQHQAALEKMTYVIEAQKNEAGPRALANEALTWVKRIMADQVKGDLLQNAADGIQNLKTANKKFKTRFATDDEEDGTESEGGSKSTPSEKNDSEQPAPSKAEKVGESERPTAKE